MDYIFSGNVKNENEIEKHIFLDLEYNKFYTKWKTIA